jgi:hypothetical protein
MPITFLFELVLLEFPEWLFLFELDDFDELGDEDVGFTLGVELLFFELLLLPLEFEDPEDPPDDCFSFLSLIIIC